MQRRHLGEALERGAAIIDCGDLFCAMQGKYDKRASKSAVRPEHNNDRYLDSLVETAGAFFAPYASNIISIGVGNHESSIIKKHETNLTERLCALLNAAGGNVFNGGYSGWVIFSFQEARSSSKPYSYQIVLHYDHGFGGGGAATADMLSHHRRAVYLPDADIVVSGHVHESWTREMGRVRLTKSGELRHDVQTHIKLPTYKEEYEDGYSGWHVETGKSPRPIGAAWLRFYFDHISDRIEYEIIRAR